jgi:DNA invertase Pin-like site-specific DNA recombinase
MRRGPKKKVTAEIEQKIVKMRQEKVPLEKIAEVLGLGLTSVARYARKHNLGGRAKSTKDNEEQIFGMLKDGYSTTKIAEVFDFNVSSIERF